MVVPADGDVVHVVGVDQRSDHDTLDRTDRVLAVEVTGRLRLGERVNLIDLKVVEDVEPRGVGRADHRVGVLPVDQNTQRHRFVRQTDVAGVEDAVVVGVVVDVTGDRPELQLTEVVVDAVLVPAETDLGELIVPLHAALRAVDGSELLLAVGVAGRLGLADRVDLVDIKAAELVVAVLVGPRRPSDAVGVEDRDVVVPHLLVEGNGYLGDRNIDAALGLRLVDAVVVVIFEDITGDRPVLQFAEVVVDAVIIPMDGDFGELIVPLHAALHTVEGSELLLAVGVAGRLGLADRVDLLNVEVIELVMAERIGHGGAKISVGVVDGGVMAVGVLPIEGDLDVGDRNIDSALGLRFIESVVVVILEDVTGDRPELQLAEVVVDAVVVPMDVNFGELIVPLNAAVDAVEGSELLLAVGVVARLGLADRVDLLDIEIIELVVTERVGPGGARIAVFVARDGVTPIRPLHVQRHGDIGDRNIDSPLSGRFIEAVVVVILEDIAGDRPEQQFAKVVLDAMLVPPDVDLGELVFPHHAAGDVVEGSELFFAVDVFGRLGLADGVFPVDGEVVEAVVAGVVGQLRVDHLVLRAVPLEQFDLHLGDSRLARVHPAVVVAVLEDIPLDRPELQLAEVVIDPMLIPPQLDLGDVVVPGDFPDDHAVDGTRGVLTVDVVLGLDFAHGVGHIEIPVIPVVDLQVVELVVAVDVGLGGHGDAVFLVGDVFPIPIEVEEPDGNLFDPLFVRVEPSVVVPVLVDIPLDGTAKHLAEVILGAVASDIDTRGEDQRIGRDRIILRTGARIGVDVGDAAFGVRNVRFGDDPVCSGIERGELVVTFAVGIGRRDGRVDPRIGVVALQRHLDPRDRIIFRVGEVAVLHDVGVDIPGDRRLGGQVDVGDHRRGIAVVIRHFRAVAAVGKKMDLLALDHIIHIRADIVGVIGDVEGRIARLIGQVIDLLVHHEAVGGEPGGDGRPGADQVEVLDGHGVFGHLTMVDIDQEDQFFPFGHHPFIEEDRQGRGAVADFVRGVAVEVVGEIIQADRTELFGDLSQSIRVLILRYERERSIGVMDNAIALLDTAGAGGLAGGVEIDLVAEVDGQLRHLGRFLDILVADPADGEHVPHVLGSALEIDRGHRDVQPVGRQELTLFEGLEAAAMLESAHTDLFANQFSPFVSFEETLQRTCLRLNLNRFGTTAKKVI